MGQAALLSAFRIGLPPVRGEFSSSRHPLFYLGQNLLDRPLCSGKEDHVEVGGLPSLLVHLDEGKSPKGAKLSYPLSSLILPLKGSEALLLKIKVYAHKCYFIHGF